MIVMLTTLSKFGTQCFGTQPKDAHRKQQRQPEWHLPPGSQTWPPSCLQDIGLYRQDENKAIGKRNVDMYADEMLVSCRMWVLE